VTISWTSASQNIGSSGGGNGIVINGQPMYYQVAGTPAGTGGISAMFGVRMT
jgi:hypothetical protein